MSFLAEKVQLPVQFCSRLRIRHEKDRETERQTDRQTTAFIALRPTM